MGRSQRHMLVEQGATATGETVAQGVVAPGLLMQAGEPETAGVSNEVRGIEDIEVPVGPPGGPLSGSTLTGAIPEAILAPEPPEPTEPPEPEPGMEPTLTAVNPNTAALGDPDVTMVCTGTNFTETSVIMFAGQPEPIVFVSDTEISTVVKPSLPWGVVTLPVAVKQGTYETEELDFSFTEAAAPEGEAGRSGRVFPLGPFTINRIEDHADGLAVKLAEGDVQAGDTVLVEATGNTDVNGSYTVLKLENGSVIIDSNFELDMPIEGKGRFTVNTGEGG